MKNTARLPEARTENLVIRELDEETLVYDMECDEAHCLNRTAALVWSHCDGKTTAMRAVRALGKKLDAPVDADVVWLAVKQLQSFHLVEGAKRSPAVSRRNLVLKYAPLALALPVIMSISVPTPVQAASCALENEDCSSMPCCPGSGACVGMPPVCNKG